MKKIKEALFSDRNINRTSACLCVILIAAAIIVGLVLRQARQQEAQESGAKWEAGRQLAAETYGDIWVKEVIAPPEPGEEPADDEEEIVVAYFYIDTQTGVQYLARKSPASPLVLMVGKDGNPLLYDFSTMQEYLDEQAAKLAAAEAEDTMAARRHAKQAEQSTLVGDERDAV